MTSDLVQFPQHLLLSIQHGVKNVIRRWDPPWLLLRPWQLWQRSLSSSSGWHCLSWWAGGLQAAHMTQSHMTKLHGMMLRGWSLALCGVGRELFLLILPLTSVFWHLPGPHLMSTSPVNFVGLIYVTHDLERAIFKSHLSRPPSSSWHSKLCGPDQWGSLTASGFAASTNEAANMPAA